MRNIALGRSCLENDEADRVVYALCAPRQHQAIWRRWAEAVDLLGTNLPMVELPADGVLEHHTPGDVEVLRTRYGL